ncbi:MAG: hypothetical protein U1E15_13475 [Hyphomicrobiales bacterium]
MTILTRLQDIERLFQVLNELKVYDFLLASFGTFLGAYIAFRLSFETEKVRNDIEEDTNLIRAFQAATTILSAALNFKKQVVLPKTAEIEALTNQIETHLAKVPTESEIRLNVVQLLKMHPQISLYNTDIVARLSCLTSLAGRPFQCAEELRRSCMLLDILIDSINKQIPELMAIEDDEVRMHLMLGLMQGEEERTVDERFRHAHENLLACTDDIIFFAKLIATDIECHQVDWRKRRGIKNRRRLSMIDDRSIAHLFPDSSKYITWQDLPISPLY